MVYSMTGYGRGEAQGGPGRVVVELRSVNHRFLDVVIRTPRELSILEDRLRAEVQQRVDRGRLEVYVSVDREGQPRHELQVDKNLALAYHKALKEIQNELNLAGSVDLSTLAQLPDVFVLEEVQEEANQYWPLVQQAARHAVDSLLDMRANEGRSLAEDMLQRISSIEGEVAAIHERAPLNVSEYRERLRARVEELLGETAVDNDRLEAEVVYYAERSDITEELVRLESHLSQFRNTVGSEGAVGRKLNFILQEIHREVNTIGSKAGDAEIGRSVVEIKTQLEKLREQVQNIE